MEYIRQNKGNKLTLEAILELHDILGHEAMD